MVSINIYCVSINLLLAYCTEVTMKGTTVQLIERGSTLVLRIVITVIGMAVLALCLFGLPLLINSELKGDFDYGWIFLGMYITAVPFFVGLQAAWKLLNLIEKNKAFTKASVKALEKIKYCAAAISGLCFLGMPYVFYVADQDDAPGTVAVGLVIIGASFVVAAFAAVFQRLVQNAVNIKTENDLTV